MGKFFEMINQEFKVQGTKYQIFPNFRVLQGVSGAKSYWFFANVCTVSALSDRLRCNRKWPEPLLCE